MHFGHRLIVRQQDVTIVATKVSGYPNRELEDYPNEVAEILASARDKGAKTGYCNVILKDAGGKILDEEVFVL
jgi:hypothetical protein